MPKITLKTGSLRQRPDGLYEVRFYLNKKRFSVYDRDQNQVIKKANKLIKEKTQKFEKQNAVPELREWLLTWLEIYKRPYVSVGQYKALETNIRLHILPNVKNKPIDQYTTTELQLLVNSITTQRGKKDAFEILTNAFEKALTDDKIQKSPCKGLTKPKYKKGRGSALSQSEQKEFLQAISQRPEKNAFLFLLYSGLRRNELLTLKWSDIDFEKNLIYVHGTKTESSNRVLPLFRKLKNILTEIPKTEKKLFSFHADTLTHSFKEICPNHKLHDLRHTFATNCLEIGIPMKVVQKWLGHSDFGTTANIYSDVLDEFNKKQAEIYDKLT